MTSTFLCLAIHASLLGAPAPCEGARAAEVESIQGLDHPAPYEEASLAIETVEEDSEAEAQSSSASCAYVRRELQTRETSALRVRGEERARRDAVAEHDPRGPPAR